MLHVASVSNAIDGGAPQVRERSMGIPSVIRITALGNSEAMF